MKKFLTFLVIVAIVLVGYRVISRRINNRVNNQEYNQPGNQNNPGSNKPTPKKVDGVPTITSLPGLPNIPLLAKFWSDDQKKDLIFEIIDTKLSTYPKSSSKSYRIGKFVGTGLQPKYGLREDELKILADNYDMNSLTANQEAQGKILKKYNPDFKLFLYIDSGIQPEQDLNEIGADVGNIDSENIDWIIKNHPDWLLKDANGNFIKSGTGTLSNAGEYWADPGNREWQEFFAKKVNQAIERSGNIWSGVLLDQFFGRIENYTNYAGTPGQTKYKSDAEFQTAQLSFLKHVSELVRVPIIANLDGSTAVDYPNFMLKVAEAAGGVENEIIPFKNSNENDASVLSPEVLKSLLTTILQIPNYKYVRINSKPGGMNGNIKRTLYAYYTYLLVAGPDKQIYWTTKEGDSSVPHCWFKEFGLNLGIPLGSPNLGDEKVWHRQYQKAEVLVNPYRSDKQFSFSGTRYNILGEVLNGGVSVPPVSGMLLFESIEDLNAALSTVK